MNQNCLNIGLQLFKRERFLKKCNKTKKTESRIGVIDSSQKPPLLNYNTTYSTSKGTNKMAGVYVGGGGEPFFSYSKVTFSLNAHLEN